jgi:leader peptidase (prepilin peptidase)/N-methyltransferase
MFSPFFLFSSVILFIFGTVIGSFLNVIIYRTIQGETWVKGRSKCESCHKQIKWYDNIPLLSYFLLKGQCRYCGNIISLSHPVIEFLTGVMFVWWYWGGSFFFRLTHQPFRYVQPIFWLMVGLLLLVIFFSDLIYYIIPDEAVIILTALTLFYRIWLIMSHVMQPVDFYRAILGALIASGFFGALWLFTKGKGMGLGDVKFAIPFGLLLGWPNFLVGLFLAFIFGSVVSLSLIAVGRKKFRQTVPFGPFLILSTVVTLVWGTQIMHWYLHLLQ